MRVDEARNHERPPCVDHLRIARVHAGAHEARREPSAVDIWFTARSSLHEDRAAAIDNVKASVSSILNHAMRFGLDGKHVPDDMRAKIQDYVDGYELLRRIRALGPPPGRHLPAIALTAFARSEDRTRALRAGFLAHVAKPVEPSELLAPVASVVGRAGDQLAD